MPGVEENIPRSGERGEAECNMSRIPARTEYGRPNILIAEDNPALAWLLTARLTRLQLTAHATDNPQEARRWLEEKDGALLLDGSIFKQMEIPLSGLPKRVILWSGDAELIEEGRRAGVRTILKTDLESLDRLLREIASAAREMA